MKRLTALLLCLIMLFALTACSKDESGLRKVTLNEVTRSVFYAPLYVACSKGFFAAEGLEVDIVTGGGRSKAPSLPASSTITTRSLA